MGDKTSLSERANQLSAGSNKVMFNTVIASLERQENHEVLSLIEALIESQENFIEKWGDPYDH